VAPLPASPTPSADRTSPGDPSAGAAPSRPTALDPAAASAGSWRADGDGFRRTFRTDGGEVEFVAAKDAVQVISSPPKPGYTVNVSQFGRDSVMVSFFGGRKTSRVWVRWWNGPYGEVTESVD
jgi:hypothetical protein